MITTECVTALIHRNWMTLGGGEPVPARMSFLMLTKGNEPVGKIVLLAFVEPSPTPRFVVKLGRSKGHNPALEAEYRNLTVLAPYGRYGNVVTPRALLSAQVEARVLLVQSVIEGRELGHLGPRARRRDVLSSVVDWLIHLGRSTGDVVAEDRRSADISELAERAARRATAAEEQSVLDRVCARLHALPATPLPRVFEQRDMGTWNVLVSADGRVGIVDWESARPCGFPAWDLFYFLAYYGLMVDGARSAGDRDASLRETFYGRRSFATTAQAAVRRYARALALEDDWLVALFQGCWLHHAVSQATRRNSRLSDSLFWRMLAWSLDRGEPRFLPTA